MVHPRHHPELDLMVFTVSGAFSEEELVEAGREFYAMDSPPLRVFWDLTEAGPEHFTLEGLRRAAARLSSEVHGREGGKTAAAAPQDLPFALARQFASLIASESYPIAVRIFRTRQEALSWLEVEEERLEEDAP